MTVPEDIEKRCEKFGLTVAVELENIVIIDTLNRNKILYYGTDLTEVVHILVDLENDTKKEIK